MADAHNDVFISYKSEDLPLAEELNRRLLAEGFAVWFDKRKLDLGTEWHDEIEAACEASRIVLPVLTPDWKNSLWTRYETYGAENVIPLLFKGEWGQCATPPLLRYQGEMLDFTEEPDPRWVRLFAAIRKYLEQLPVPRAKVELAANVTCRPNPHFVGREAELAEAHEKLFPPPTTHMTQGPAVAITGLGGVGKTSLAREYVEKFWRLYESIHWIRADQNLVTQFADLAVELELIPELSADAENDARRALRQLGTQARRLLIFDDAPDEAGTQHWIPGSGGCHTIITSRFSTWSPGFATVELKRLSIEAAVEFLLRRCPGAGGIAEEASTLAEELGCLPLALEQAGAFIDETKSSFAEYRELYAQSRQELLARPVPGSTQHWDPVATTWLLTVGKLSPLAQAILRLVAFLASDAIPRDLLDSAGEALSAAVAEINGAAAEPPAPVALVTALGELSRYSMIELDKTVFGVHRLVQEVERDRLDTTARKRWADWAVAMVNEAFPHVELGTWSRCAQIAPHAVSCAQHIEKEKLISGKAGRLLSDAASYLVDRADFSAAELLYTQALEINRELLGEEHPDFAACLNNLAELHKRQGDYSDAEPLFKRAVEIWRGALGDGHPDYARGLSNLGTLYRLQGEYAAAKPLLQRASRILRKALGKEHPDVAASLSHLSLLHAALGDNATSEALDKQVLSINLKMLGEDHPTVASSLSNLAQAYQTRGDYAAAEPLERRALEIRRKWLGENHPDFGNSLNNLAGLQHARRNYAEAEILFRQALEIRRKALGEEHPQFATVLHNLAVLYREQRKYEAAIPLARQALDIFRRSLGDQHPYTLMALGHLMACSESQEDENVATALLGTASSP